MVLFWCLGLGVLVWIPFSPTKKLQMLFQFIFGFADVAGTSYDFMQMVTLCFFVSTLVALSPPAGPGLFKATIQQITKETECRINMSGRIEGFQEMSGDLDENLPIDAAQ